MNTVPLTIQIPINILSYLNSQDESPQDYILSTLREAIEYRLYLNQIQQQNRG